MNIGKNINRLRQEHRMTQEQFAEQFHVSRQAVSNWENEKTFPDLKTLVEISDNFNVSLDVLIKEDMNFVLEVDRRRMRLKRMKKVMLILALLILVCMYCLFTTSGALRSAVFFSGNPIQAVMLNFRALTPKEMDNWMSHDLKNESIYQISSSVPQNVTTGIPMQNWIIENQGIFKFAKPYGLNGMNIEDIKEIQVEFLEQNSVMQLKLEQKDTYYVANMLLKKQQMSDRGFVFAEGGYRVVLRTEFGHLNLYPYGGDCSIIRVGDKGTSYLWLDDDTKQKLEEILSAYMNIGEYSGLWEW